MAPCQGANGDNAGKCFDLVYNNEMFCVLIRITSMM